MSKSLYLWASLALTPFSGLVRAYTLFTLYAWFVATSLHVPQLSPVALYGLSTFWSYFSLKVDMKDADEELTDETRLKRFSYSIALGFLLPLFFLLHGWIVYHLFIASK